MADGYDVRFNNDWIRERARQLGASMKLPTDRGAESTDPRHRLAAALDDNEHLKRRLTALLREKEELRVLLRSSLWELARAHGAKNPQVWSAEWYRKKKAMP